MQDVLKTFWRRLSRDILARCLEDILKTILQGVLKTSWRRLEDVLKTFWRRMTKTNILVLIKTSWRRLLKTYDYGEYIHLDQDVLKTSSEDEDKRPLQDVFKMSSSRRMFSRLTTFIISSISSLEFINVVLPDPNIFLWKAASVADAAAVIPMILKWF